MLNKIQNLNYLLIFLIILISFIGAAGLYSAAGGSYNPWASRHLIRLALFMFLAVILALINIKFIYQFAYVFFILSLLLLLSVELIGVFGKGATRWINVFGFSIQPSELIKITIILALARFYHDLKFDEIKRIKNLFFPILILFLPFALVVIQPDLGTALSIAMLGILIPLANRRRTPSIAMLKAVPRSGWTTTKAKGKNKIKIGRNKFFIRLISSNFKSW